MRWTMGGVAAAGLMLGAAAPAAADPPTMVEQTFSGAVSDAGEACGDPVSWQFTGEARITRFFDSNGSLVRIQVHVRESGTITSLATGEVVALPRTAFLERVLLVDSGTIIVEDNGLSVRITGPDDFLMDVGRFVVRLDPNELLQSSGQHPIREINPFSTDDPALLAAFCGLFD
jgi:hypothetical protein